MRRILGIGTRSHEKVWFSRHNCARKGVIGGLIEKVWLLVVDLTAPCSIIDVLFYAIFLRPAARGANGIALDLYITGLEMPAVLNAFYGFDTTVGSTMKYDIAID